MSDVKIICKYNNLGCKKTFKTHCLSFIKHEKNCIYQNLQTNSETKFQTTHDFYIGTYSIPITDIVDIIYVTALHYSDPNIRFTTYKLYRSIISRHKLAGCLFSFEETYMNLFRLFLTNNIDQINSLLSQKETIFFFKLEKSARHIIINKKNVYQEHTNNLIEQICQYLPILSTYKENFTSINIDWKELVLMEDKRAVIEKLVPSNKLHQLILLEYIENNLKPTSKV